MLKQFFEEKKRNTKRDSIAFKALNPKSSSVSLHDAPFLRYRVKHIWIWTYGQMSLTNMWTCLPITKTIFHFKKKRHTVPIPCCFSQHSDF